MFIEELQHKARESSIATMSRIRAMSGGTSITASNVAVGDYAQTNSYMYGRNAADERELLHYRGWVYSFIRPLAVTIAGQPVRVARKTSGSNPSRPSPKRMYKATKIGMQKMPTWLKGIDPQKLDIFEDHPILDVIDQPNDIMVKWHLMYLTVASLQLTGKMHWWMTVDKKTKRPVIWPIPSSWIQPVHTREKAFDHWKLMPGGTGEPVDIPRDEIVYFYYPDPSNPLGAVSPLGAAARMVVADDAIWEAQSRSFRQGIWPGLAVIAGEYVDDDEDNGGRPLLEREQRQQIYNAIRMHWGGVMNMNEPLILDALIKDVKKITQSPAEMDFLQSGKTTRTAIQQAFGANDSVVGATEGLNRATAIAARYNFADFNVNPLLQMISETLTVTVGVALSDTEDKLFIWIEPYHPDEQGERRSNFQIASQIGVKIRQNEGRTLLCNLPPLTADEGGEEFCQAQPKPSGPKGAEDAAEPAAPNQQNGQEGDEDMRNDSGEVTPTSDADAGQVAEAGGKSALVLHKNSKVPTKALSIIRQTSVERKDRRKRRQDLFLKAHGRHEKKLAPLVKQLFLEQGIACMEGLVREHAKGINNADSVVDKIYDPAEWTARLKQVVGPELHKAMLKGAVSEWTSAMTRKSLVSKAAPDIEDMLIDLPPDIQEAVNDALQELVDADFWDDVAESTKQDLVDTLQEGLANNESLYQLCKRIGDDPTTDVGLANPGIFEPGVEFGSNPVLGDVISTARSKLIARTEVSGAMNAGHVAAIDSLVQDGIATGKAWSALDDEHTREAHADADDEYGIDNPIAPDEPFILHDEKEGDVEAQYPGDMDLPPSQRCNCRCMAVATFAEDAQGNSDDEDSQDDEAYNEESDIEGGELQEAGMEQIAMNIADYIVKQVAKEWDEDKHPRAADGKFGSGGGDKPGEKPDDKGDKTDDKTNRTRALLNDIHAINEAGRNAKTAIEKAVDITKYSAHAVAQASKHVNDKIKELVHEHPKWAKLIGTAAVIAASEAVLHVAGVGELGAGAHVGIATGVELCADRVKEFASKIAGYAIEKSASEGEPTDSDAAAIVKAGKEFWDDVVSSFKPPKDAIQDPKEKAVYEAVRKAICI